MLIRLSPIYLSFAALLLSLGCSAEQPPLETRTINVPTKEFWEPFGLAEKNGVLLVSDGENGRILRLSSDGLQDVFADGFETPSHIAFDSKGNLLVVDSGAHTVVRIDTNGGKTVIAGRDGRSGKSDGPATEALLNGPVGIAIDGDRVLVSDTYNDRIVEIVGGNLRTIAGAIRGFRDGEGSEALFDTPAGLLLMPDGALLVADSGNGVVRRIDRSGNVTAMGRRDSDRIVDGTLETVSFEKPSAFGMTPSGAVLISDGDSIRMMDSIPFPVVSTLSSKSGGFLDGVLSKSRFSRPSAILVKGDGDVLIADSDNGLVRVIGRNLGRTLSADEFHGTLPTAEEFRESGPSRWPFEPADAPRDIAGTLGELRGSIGAESRWSSFHNGLDIAGSYGEKTFFIRDEKVLKLDAARFFNQTRELIRLPRVGYIHLRIGRDSDDVPFDDPRFQFDVDENGKPTGLRIRRGSRFLAGEPIGTLNSQNHVHLVVGRYGYEHNAIIAIDLPGLVDTTPPVIEAIQFIGLEVEELLAEPYEFQQTSRVRALVNAWDRKDANPLRRRLGIFEAGYGIVSGDGTVVVEEKTTLSFKGMPDSDSVALVYGEGSRAGATGITTFRYIIGNQVSVDGFKEDWINFSDLRAGEYEIRIFVTDFFGNRAERSVPIRIIE
jgi:DNA-binding beta-propeller fold protein YncE